MLVDFEGRGLLATYLRSSRRNSSSSSTLRTARREGSKFDEVISKDAEPAAKPTTELARAAKRINAGIAAHQNCRSAVGVGPGWQGETPVLCRNRSTRPEKQSRQPSRVFADDITSTYQVGRNSASLPSGRMLSLILQRCISLQGTSNNDAFSVR